MNNLPLERSDIYKFIKLTQNDLNRLYRKNEHTQLQEHDISGLDFRGMDLSKFGFIIITSDFILAPIEHSSRDYREVSKGFYSAIFHEDPETNTTIIKMILDSLIFKKGDDIEIL